MEDKTRITIRHPRKREFVVKLAMRQETAQAVLSSAIDNYLDEKETGDDTGHNRE